MSAGEDRWSLYSASQNLAAVLNDPNRGKQTNFFVKTWGDAFVERTDIEKSPFLPDITYVHFEIYLRKIARRLRRHRKLSQTKQDASLAKLRADNENSSSEGTLDDVPDIFTKHTFPLNTPQLFNEVFPHINKGSKSQQQSERLIQEKLSHYLDIVEVQIAKQVSQKSGAFFHAMTSHDTIMEQMGSACKEVRQLRTKVQSVDKNLAKDSLKMLGLARSRSNQVSLQDKLKLMSTVLQTQPTIQLLLSSSDYVAALELITSTQEVLCRELAGVTSLRHLPSQLKEMSKLIDKMLCTEFERYAAADLHRPMQNTEVVVLLDAERLVSLVAGLLRQSHLQFLEIYKKEAISAAQTLMKQLLIEQLADVEDDMEHCLTGSGEAPPTLDAAHWLKVVALASEALGKLVNHVRAVHDVIKDTADISAGVPSSSISSSSSLKPSSSSSSDPFLTPTEHSRVTTKLSELLTAICDYCHERLAAIVSNQTSETQIITSPQIAQLSTIVDRFSDTCARICGRTSPALKAAFKIQAGNYLHKFHSSRREKLELLLVAERWKVAEVPTEFQVLVDNLSGGTLSDVIVRESDSNSKYIFEKPADCLRVAGEEFVTIGTVLILVRLVTEYCLCATSIPILSNVIYRNLVELLRAFNSRSFQLVFGAGALSTTDLKTITSRNIALCSRALQLVLWMIPVVSGHFTSQESSVGLYQVQTEIVDHIQQLETKVLTIMNKLLTEQLSDWDARPPVPSTAFRNISRQLNKLHEAVGSVLPEKQVNYIYQTLHKNFKKRLRDQIVKLNIRNNGGPQHGVVTSELTFYIETMKNLGVLTEKHSLDDTMDDIWR